MEDIANLSLPRPMSADHADRDVDLMLRVRDGDEGAFEELVRRHTRTVLNLIYRYVGDASLADDVAQEVFVKVYRFRDRYEPKARFSTWLYRITVNHCLNEIRSRRNRPTASAPAEELLEQPEGVSPDERMRRMELREAVRAALDALPSNQRMAVLLARYEELSYTEIAATLGLSLEAVKSLLFRAKENLQQSLAKIARSSS